MSTKNFVPRANNEGGIGTEAKQWGSVWSKNVYVDGTNVKNTLTTLEQDLGTLNTAAATKATTFNSVALMKEAHLEPGMVAMTTGYHNPNDGGASVYTIRAKVPGDVDNGGSIIFLDNGNVAELITDGTVNVKQFGAIGNGTDDDTTVFQNTYSYAQAKGFVPFVGVATYKITSNITGTFNSFGEVTITGGGTVDIINLQEVVSDVSDIRDEVVDETASAKTYAENAQASATSAAGSASSASTTATQLMDYLETKETLTAPAVDATLTISGAAADAKVTGDAIADLRSSVDYYDDVNMFLSATWQQGLWASMSTFSNTTINANNVRISTQVELPDGVTAILIKPITTCQFRAGLFDAEGNSIDSFADMQQTEWSKTSTTPIKYVRISYGFYPNKAISAYNGAVALFINGITSLQSTNDRITSLQSDYNAKVDEYVPQISTLIADAHLVRLDASNIELGALISGQPSASAVRARSKTYIDVPSGKIFVFGTNDKFEYSVLTYKYDNGYENESGYKSGTNVLDINSISTNPCKIKFVIKLKTSPYDLSNYDFDNLNIFYVILPNNGLDIRLTLMSHNCGQFNYGVSGGYSGDDVDTKVQDWKDMIIKNKPDIIFAQELSTYFDSDNTINAYNTIYKPLLPYRYFKSYGHVLSKMRYGASWQIDLTVTYDGNTYSRSAGCVIVSINGVKIVLCSAHLSPGIGSPYDEVRASQRALLISALAGYKHVIIGGDFNASADSFYDDFVTAGYSCANHGFFGVFNTTTDNQKIDNIIIKGFSFYNASVNPVDGCTSDHYPIIAEVHISDV